MGAQGYSLSGKQDKTQAGYICYSVISSVSTPCRKYLASRSGHDCEFNQCHPYDHVEIEQSAVSDGIAVRDRSWMQHRRTGLVEFL
jgi:hypothetical protein